MENEFKSRNPILIKLLEWTLWPFIKFFFQLKVDGIQNIPKNRPILYVANHNVGALIESHSTLFVINQILRNKERYVFGFTHPSIFKVPLISHYFRAIGAISATYPQAKETFQRGHSLMIFPGGNSQALRPIWKYKQNSFRNSHGWAKIAQENNVDVIPITFKNSHFVNPIFFSGEWVSKFLILPWILKLKVSSISLGQIILSVIAYYLTSSYIIAYFVFVLTPISIVLPFKISMTIHQPISHQISQDELEDAVDEVMKGIYKPNSSLK